jgi:hypothetical protein
MSRSSTPRGPVGYIVRIAGHLDALWSAWFSDFTLHARNRWHQHPSGASSPTKRNSTACSSKSRDLGVTLLSVEITEAPDA